MKVRNIILIIADPLDSCIRSHSATRSRWIQWCRSANWSRSNRYCHSAVNPEPTLRWRTSCMTWKTCKRLSLLIPLTDTHKYTHTTWASRQQPITKTYLAFLSALSWVVPMYRLYARRPRCLLRILLILSDTQICYRCDWRYPCTRINRNYAIQMSTFSISTLHHRQTYNLYCFE